MKHKIVSVQRTDASRTWAAQPWDVDAEMVGELAVHPLVARGGPNLQYWTVTIPNGLAVGHFDNREVARDAALFLNTVGIKWSGPVKDAKKMAKRLNLKDRLKDKFSMKVTV
jgi:hypothetical protein